MKKRVIVVETWNTFSKESKQVSQCDLFRLLVSVEGFCLQAASEINCPGWPSSQLEPLFTNLIKAFHWLCFICK